MRNPSKTTKILVLACFIGLLTAYVLYAIGILNWPTFSSEASAKLKNHVLSESPDTPPFRLPSWVIINDFTRDSAPVVAFKSLSGNEDTVALLLGFPATVPDEGGLEHLSSSKSGAVTIHHTSEGFDSVVVPRSWLNTSASTYTPKYLTDESFWLMSSKSGAPRKTTHPDRVRQSQLLSEVSNVKWHRLDDEDASGQQQQNVMNRK